MIWKKIQYLKFIIIKLCLLGVFFSALPADAQADEACFIYTQGRERPAPKYPDHPKRAGFYFYLGDTTEEIFGGNCPNRYAIKKSARELQNQITDAYSQFAGCEDKKDCQEYAASPASWSHFTEGMSTNCGARWQFNIKFGRFYYCAGRGMMERTDFIPPNGCAANTYAATMNCQPCPNGTYSPKGSTKISQCVDRTSNAGVWSISKADRNGFFDCPAGTNTDKYGNCTCKKGLNWAKKVKKCVKKK